ncbi:hypothetical protein BGZ83_009596 [Gryganskiella cystojenkinii]|nr:hypothetical protein BGZ83_009596 [Gryganskiella cystojenkinii]
MWNAGKTGSNTTPLGPRKRALGDVTIAETPDQPGRGRSSEPGERSSRFSDQSRFDRPASSQSPKPTDSTSVNQEEGGDEPRKKRRSRWAAEEEKVTIPGMPTALPTNMSEEQLEMFLLHTRLEEITRKLRTGDVLPLDRARSRSPEPVYNAEGKRTNTRENRYRKKLEDERHQLIDGAIKKYPDFRPPADYKRPTKTTEKVYIPVKEFPEINFIGLLIGPRGNTLKKMETESGAKISIRGKGSVKEGKSRSDSASSSNLEEDLHCLVTADTEEKVNKAIQLINKIIETSASVPEGQNELKRMQLRELASLNGTLRDDENQTCLNCGGLGHRRYECPEIHNVTINLVCGICGGHGHATRDCRERNNPEAAEKAQQRNQKIDSEYLNLMAELGEQVPADVARAAAAPERENERERDSRGPSGHYGPPPPRGQSGSAPPPWANRERDHRDSRDSRDSRDHRDQRDYRDSRDSRDSREGRDSRDSAPPPWAARSSAPAPWQQHNAHAPAPPPPAAPWQQPASSAPWSAAPGSDSSAPPPPPPPGYPPTPAGYPYNPYAGYYAPYGAPPPPPPVAPPGWAGASGLPPHIRTSTPISSPFVATAATSPRLISLSLDYIA